MSVDSPRGLGNLGTDTGVVVFQMLGEEEGGSLIFIFAGHHSESPDAVEALNRINLLVGGTGKDGEGLGAVGKGGVGRGGRTRWSGWERRSARSMMGAFLKSVLARISATLFPGCFLGQGVNAAGIMGLPTGDEV